MKQLSVARLNVHWRLEMLENLKRSQWKLRGLLKELQTRTEILEAVNKEQTRLIRDISEVIDGELSSL